MKNLIVLMALSCFLCVAVTDHSYGAEKHRATQEAKCFPVHVVKVCLAGVDHSFVCTADVATVFLLPVAPYGEPKNAVLTLFITGVLARSNSPPFFC